MGKAVNGKSKGNSFERKIANLLSDRFQTFLGKTQAFRRSVDSGSYFGASNMSRMATHDLDYAVFGDIVTPRNFKYSIECKHYKTPPSFKKVLQKNVADWDKWLEQAEQDSVNSNKELLLIVKYNGVDEIAFVKKEHALECAFLYKAYYVYLLSDLLTLADQHFFEDNAPAPLA